MSSGPLSHMKHFTYAPQNKTESVVCQTAKEELFCFLINYDIINFNFKQNNSSFAVYFEFSSLN